MFFTETAFNGFNLLALLEEENFQTSPKGRLINMIVAPIISGKLNPIFHCYILSLPQEVPITRKERSFIPALNY